MSILIFDIASSAIFSSVAATARIGSPIYTGLLVNIAALGASTIGTSSAVSIPTSPSIESMAEVSILTTFPCAIGLVYIRAKTIPSALKSSAKRALPVTFPRISGGTKSFPICLYFFMSFVPMHA